MFKSAYGGVNIATAILRLPAVSLGSRAVGWVEAKVNDWLNQQIEASRKAAH